MKAKTFNIITTQRSKERPTSFVQRDSINSFEFELPFVSRQRYLRNIFIANYERLNNVRQLNVP